MAKYINKWNTHSIMDEKDERILEILKENSSLSTQQISKRTSIPITTVHNRIKKLKKDGVIEKYTVVLNHKKIGKAISSYISVIVDYRYTKQSQHEMAKKLKSKDFVEEVSIVTGSTDMIVKIRVKDIDELNHFVIKYLRMLEGVERTETLVILDEI